LRVSGRRLDIAYPTEKGTLPMNLTDGDFERLYRFIRDNYGLDLSKKRQLVVSRLTHTLASLGFSDFGPYIDHLLSVRNPNDIDALLSKLTTNYTFFMREQEHFTFLQNTILPDIIRRHQRDRVLSIWSAGCSSGEEPYTISMFLLDYLGAHAGEWDTKILATDISQKALTSAQTGTYELPDTVPADWKRKYFVPDGHSDRFKVAPVIKNNVLFRTFNLMNPIRFPAQFDIIFCRNVMIYFDQPTKDALVERFYRATAPGGYLLIGHSESINRSIGYQYLAPSTFRKP
jgi:chemotaxis protein methyltransferase CheR